MHDLFQSFPASCRAPVRWSGIGIVLLSMLFAGPELYAQQPAEGDVRWRNSLEATYLLNGGNSVSSTLGLQNALRRATAEGEWRLDLTARRTDATRIRRRAVAVSEETFRVEEERDRERTAERYAAESRYDRRLSEHFFVSGGAGWERNEFAGFNHRTVLFGGAGNQWLGEEREVKLGYGVTYTLRRDVVPDPSRDDSFAGLRMSFDYAEALSETVGLELRWVGDGNLQELSEVRGNFTQSLTSALTDRLALKTTLQLLAENDPPLEELPLVDPDGTPLGDEVRVPLRRLDHSLSLSLVITM